MGCQRKLYLVVWIVQNELLNNRYKTPPIDAGKLSLSVEEKVNQIMGRVRFGEYGF